MPNRISSVTKIADGLFLCKWSGGTPPYTMWHRGIQHQFDMRYSPDANGATTATAYLADSTTADEPPAYEVLGSTDGTAYGADYPCTVSLQWGGTTDAAEYEVERYVDSAWETQCRIPEAGQGYYRWTSPLLTDLDAEQFRVTAVGWDAADGQELDFAVTACVLPEPPLVLVTHSTGYVVFSDGS